MRNRVALRQSSPRGRTDFDGAGLRPGSRQGNRSVRAGTSRRAARAAVVLAALFLMPADALAAPTVAPGARAAVVVSAASFEAFLAEKMETSRSLAARRDLPASMILRTQPRQQTTDYNCGPAVAQVIINYTRGLSSPGLQGGTRATNWTTQATLARWMGTSVLYGTGAPGVRKALNQIGGLKKPFPEWSYGLTRTGGPRAFHDKVVTNVAIYEMPLAIAVNPHMVRVGIYHLASWPDERPLARHWIAIRGYDGLTGSEAPIVHYTDSSGGYGGGTGNYWDLSVVLHDTNARNRGRIVW